MNPKQVSNQLGKEKEQLNNEHENEKKKGPFKKTKAKEKRRTYRLVCFGTIQRPPNSWNNKLHNEIKTQLSKAVREIDICVFSRIGFGSREIGIGVLLAKTQRFGRLGFSKFQRFYLLAKNKCKLFVPGDDTDRIIELLKENIDLIRQDHPWQSVEFFFSPRIVVYLSVIK